MAANGISRSSPTPTAASALSTLWRPGVWSVSSPSRLERWKTSKRLVMPGQAHAPRRRSAPDSSPYVMMRFVDARDQPLDVRLVQAEHGRSVERHPVHERDERVADGVEVSVVIEVLGVDRRHDRDGRRQLQERAVRLVGLGDQELALAEPGVRAEARHPSAHDDRRIVVALGEHGADHRGGRRLAVGAGDRDAVLEAHQLGQHLGAGNRPGSGAGAPPGPRRCPARRPTSRRPTWAPSTFVAAWPMKIFGAELGEPLDGVVPLLVGAGHAGSRGSGGSRRCPDMPLPPIPTKWICW